MEGAEVAEEKGVGGEVSELIRLWKSVEKSKEHLKKPGWDLQETRASTARIGCAT
jgi:hypothetical protein